MKTLVICNDPPYGTKRSWNGLRLAGTLARRDGVQVRMFLPCGAAGCPAAGQKVPDGSCNLKHMISSAATAWQPGAAAPAWTPAASPMSGSLRARTGPACRTRPAGRWADPVLTS
jgi:hypothetical protein